MPPPPPLLLSSARRKRGSIASMGQPYILNFLIDLRCVGRHRDYYRLSQRERERAERTSYARNFSRIANASVPWKEKQSILRRSRPETATPKNIAQAVERRTIVFIVQQRNACRDCLPCAKDFSIQNSTAKQQSFHTRTKTYLPPLTARKHTKNNTKSAASFKINDVSTTVEQNQRTKKRR